MINPQENIRVYDYVDGRNTVPMSDRYNFDADKLVNSGAVFITPAMDGDPNSPTYKEWLDKDGSHLITLYNVEHSSPDGWIRKAITKKSDTSGWKDNFIGKLYDGKYNQILWSLEKLGIDPNDMVIEDNSLLENINRIREVMGLVTEQEQEQVDYSECLKIIPYFYFKKTTGMADQEYDGGDLGFWNDNKIPKINDKESYERFIEHVKDAVGYKDGVYSAPEMIWDEDCGDIPSWDELLPYIQLVYLNSILSLTRKDEEMTVEDIPELISHYTEMLDINSFSDEFEWADNVIMNVVDTIAQHQDLSDDEYDELYDNIKDEYGPELIGFDNPFNF